MIISRFGPPLRETVLNPRPKDVHSKMVSRVHQIGSALRNTTTGQGPSQRPKMIANFAVTYRCTGRCKTCNIWQIENPRRNELSLDEINDIFKSNRDFLRDVKSIQITGGEPFMRADLTELVSTIHRYIPRCTFWIPTNGMNPERIVRATEEILDDLDGSGLGISVSMDGLGRTHDNMRGIEGSFNLAVETLKKLSSLKHGHPLLGLTVGMTITHNNFRELNGVFSLARQHGAEFSLRPVNYSNIFYRNMESSFPLDGLVEEVLLAIQRLGRSLMERHGLWAAVPTLRYMQGVVEYIRSPGKRQLSCSAGSDSLFLDPYGNVYPCIFLDEKMGNLRERPFGEIWGSEEADKARFRVRKGDCPGCWVECEAFRDIHKDLKGLASTFLRALIRPSTSGIT